MTNDGIDGHLFTHDVGLAVGATRELIRSRGVSTLILAPRNLNSV